MREGDTSYSDMGHSLLLNLTCDFGEIERHGHATLPFLKFDMQHWGPPIKSLHNKIMVSGLNAPTILVHLASLLDQQGYNPCFYVISSKNFIKGSLKPLSKSWIRK